MPISVNDAVVLLDWPATGVARLRINRPEKRNAIDQAVRQALIDYLTDLRVNPQCRALVLGGVGGVFSAGGDVDSMDGLTPDKNLLSTKLLQVYAGYLMTPFLLHLELVKNG